MNIPVTNNAQYDAKKFLLTTKLIHFALVLGLVMFGFVAVLISYKTLSLRPDLANPVIWVASLGCILSIAISFLVFPMYRKMTPTPTNVRSAFQHYQTVCIIRWATIEGGALFSAVIFIISKNIIPLGLLVISVAYLASRYPSQKEFIEVTEKK